MHGETGSSMAKFAVQCRAAAALARGDMARMVLAGDGDGDGRAGAQTTALQWIASGATASYGSVSEPCNHLQKFPHSQVLLLNCLQGATAIEACWKSVAWPQQGLFVGEPLLAPFAAPFAALRP